MGTKLYQFFLAAGLETPQLRSERLMGGRTRLGGAIHGGFANVRATPAMLPTP
jgi:hypothetical protein